MIVLPYVAGMLHPETARLAGEHAPGHVRAELDATDPGAYWALLAGLWHEPGELVIVEQDIGLHAGVIPGFAECPEPFCAHEYPLHLGVMRACLGCTRFAGKLKAAEPGLLEAVGEIGNDGLPAKDWRRLDVRLGDELKRRGHVVHVHSPAVQHFHDYAKAGA